MKWSDTMYVVILFVVCQILTNYVCSGSDLGHHSSSLTNLNNVQDIPWSTCYHSEITDYFKNLSQQYPNITRLISIGNSTQGRELWTMVITDNPDERPLFKPQAKFVGNINGYSGPGCVVLLKLMKFLLESYGNDMELTNLIDNVEIHILSNLNPDGYEISAPGDCYSARGRPNGNGMDLNRNFPDMFHPEDDDEGYPPPEQETSAVMSWIGRNDFVVSTSIISGAKVVSYPFDSTPNGYRKGPHMTWDDEVFKYLSQNYVGVVDEANSMEWYCPHINHVFPKGYTNGAEWQSVRGTMMDYNYVHGTFELLVCVSCCRNDDSIDNLELIWLDNKVGLLKMIQQAELSLRGQVLSADTGQPLHEAEITITFQDYRLNGERDPMPFFTNERGEFWRIVQSGRYILTVVVSKEYERKVIPFEVTDNLPPPLLIIRMDKVTKQPRRRHKAKQRQTTENPELRTHDFETTTTTTTTTTEGPHIYIPEPETHHPNEEIEERNENLELRTHDIETTTTTTTTESPHIYIPEPETHHSNEEIEEGNDNRMDVSEGFPQIFHVFHNRPFNFSSTVHDNFLAFHELTVPHKRTGLLSILHPSRSPPSRQAQNIVLMILILMTHCSYYYFTG